MLQSHQSLSVVIVPLCLSVSHSSIYFVRCLDILGAHFMDHIGAVRLCPFFLALEKAKLSRLSKLYQNEGTYLRLRLRFQLSIPRLERGPFLSFM